MHDHHHQAHAEVLTTTETDYNYFEEQPSVPSKPAMDHGSGHHGHGGHGSDGSMGSHAMQMAFHAGFNETVLFSWWQITTPSDLFWSCFGLFIFAVLYEGLKVLREALNRACFCRPARIRAERKQLLATGNGVCEANCNGDVSAPEEAESCRRRAIFARAGHRFCTVGHVTQSVLHGLQTTLSYLLMLVFMTYNVWLCGAVVLGATVGYLLFGCWRTSVNDANEHCN